MKTKRKSQEPTRGSKRKLLRVFDRRQIAEILGVAPALIRNWSTGKPFRIEPSIRAPRKRGSANLYTLEDVYLFGIVARLSEIGIRPELLKAMVYWVSKHPELLDKNWRGLVTVAVGKGGVESRLQAFPGKPVGDTPDSAWFFSRNQEKPLSAGVIFKPRDVWAEIDNQIAKLEKEGKL